jgi:pyruvate dehydrogenase E1 component
VIAATDYVRAWPQLIASYLASPFTALGTDGFGRSDTRAALRRFFEVDRHHVVLAALIALRDQGLVDPGTCAEAIARYALSTDALPSWLA